MTYAPEVACTSPSGNCRGAARLDSSPTVSCTNDGSVIQQQLNKYIAISSDSLRSVDGVVELGHRHEDNQPAYGCLCHGGDHKAKHTCQHQVATYPGSTRSNQTGSHHSNPMCITTNGFTLQARYAHTLCTEFYGFHLLPQHDWQRSMQTARGCARILLFPSDA